MIAPNDSAQLSDGAPTFTKLTPANFKWGGLLFSAATFVRSSPAYNSDGSQVLAGWPRFQVGKFGQGVMVEEGTTNLLTQNQATVETDTTGFAINGSGVTLSRDTTTSWQGNASLKAVCDGTALYQGPSITANVISGNTYTFSVYLKGSGNVVITLNGLALTSVGTDVIALTNAWTRYSITATATSSGQLNMIVHTNSTPQSITFYADGLQLEQRAYATSFVDGTRAGETLTIPTAGVLSTTEGTVEFWFYVPSVSNATPIYIFDHNPNGNNNRLLIYGDLFNGLMALVGDGTKFITTTYIKCQVGWNYTCLRYGSFGVKFTVNSTTAVDTTVSHLSTLLTSYMNLGSYVDGTYQAQGALYDDFRLSNKARTDAEILASYQSNAPLPVDQYTTAKLNFDGNLLNTGYISPGWKWNQGQYK